MRRILTVLVLAALLAVAAATVGGASPTSRAKAIVIRGVAQVGKVQAVDVAPTGDSAGDQQVFTFTTFDTRGRRTGAGHGYCVRTEAGRTALCHAAAHSVQGWLFTDWSARDGVNRSELAVIGGTGKLDGVHGSGTGTQHGTKTTIVLRVRR